MKRLLFGLSLLVGFLLLAAPVSAASIHTNDTISIAQPTNDDVFAAGEQVTITAPVTGDIFAVGRKLEIESRGTRSVFAGGNEVTLSDGSGYNAFIGGVHVVLKGVYEHDVYVAGQYITIDPSAHIKGTLRVMGELVELRGQIDGDVFLTGKTLHSGAVIGGNLTVEGNDLDFSSGSIGKDLHYTTPEEARGLDRVTVAGATNHSVGHLNEMTTQARVRQALFAFLTTLVTGAALLLLFPRKVKAVAEELRTHWAASLGIGLVFLIAMPIVSLLIMATAVGVPLGIIGLAFYGIALYAASVLSLVVVGFYLLQWAKLGTVSWWAALVLGALLITLLRMIPVIGPIIGIALFVGVTLPTLGADLMWWKKTILDK